MERAFAKEENVLKNDRLFVSNKMMTPQGLPYIASCTIVERGKKAAVHPPDMTSIHRPAKKLLRSCITLQLAFTPQAQEDAWIMTLDL